MSTNALRFVRTLLLVSSLSAPALSQQDASGRALAVELFDQAEDLFKQELFALACPKYAESYRLDPQLGVLIYLAECYEKNGQLASAWGTFREAEEMARARGDARAQKARARIDALQPRLSRLTVKVPEASRVAGLRVLRDGVALADAAWDIATPIDSGTHWIEAQAPGRKPWRSGIDVHDEKASAAVEVPLLEEEAPEAPTVVANPPPPPVAQAAPPAPVELVPPAPAPAAVEPALGSSRRLTALAVGGLGVVGFGVGGFLGVSAQSSFSDSKDRCNDAGYCTHEGTELRRSAKTKALVATAATGLGAAAIVTAAVLWFTAPGPASLTARRSPSRRAKWSVAPAPASWGVEVGRAF